MSAAHFSFMGICRNTTFEVLYCNLFSGISRWYHYHKSEVNSMKAEKKERVSKVFEGLPIYLRVCYEGQALKIA